MDPVSDYTRRLEQLARACKSLPAHLSQEKLLQWMTQTAEELLRSENCSILLYDKEQHCLRFVAAPLWQMDTMKNLGVPVERSIAGWVYAHGLPATLNDAGGDERIFRVVDREVSNETRSLLAVPVIVGGETIGVFEAVNKIDNDHYTEEDLLILETLASQAAFAIVKQRWIDEYQENYQRMLEIDQVKGDWIAILTQEMRFELGTILAKAVALPKEEDQQGVLDSVALLKEIANRLDRLGHFEKSISRLEIERHIVLPLVQRVTEAFQEEAAAKNISLIIDVPEALACACDAAKLSVALRNLVENALTFTNSGGWVRVHAEELPGFVKFAVIDRGVGIPEGELDKIFDRFYQVRPLPVRHEGVGLGLSIAKRMIELHGGDIWVESMDGMGSTFSFMLPE